jgi:hypothetical protein
VHRHGHSKEDTRHDDDAANRKITLTKEEQDIMDGKQGDVLAKLIKTIVIYGNVIVIDLLGQDFLDAVNTGDPIAVHEDGTVEIG